MPPSPKKPARPYSGPRTSNRNLWIAQIVVAFIHLYGAYMKLWLDRTVLAKDMPWVVEQGQLATVTGVVDLAGALGLLLPGLVGQKWLVKHAALGVVVLQIFASVFHGLRTEWAVIPFNLFLIGAAYYIQQGRS